LGNVVLTEKVTGSMTEINLSGYANGIYMLSVVNGNAVTTERVILNK
jgi:hypothetical protein